MKNQLQEVFDYEGSNVRVIQKDGDSWFVAKDVCKILEVNNPSQALTRIDEEDRNTIILNEGNRGNPKSTIVNESGLYALILSSRKHEAKKFKRWVTSEVLPSIRKNGMYATDELLDNPDLLVEVATKLRDERKARLAAEAVVAAQVITLEEQKPKVEYYDAVADSDDAIDMNKVAKILNISGVGRNKMYEILRDCGVMIKVGTTNVPKQMYMDKGLFNVVQRTRRQGFKIEVYAVTLVRPKGIEFINKKIKEYLSRNLSKA